MYFQYPDLEEKKAIETSGIDTTNRVRPTSDLEKLIADSIAKRDAQAAEQKQKEDEEEGEYQTLLAEARELRLAELVDQIPHELLRYCEPADEPACHYRANSIQKLREGWRPDNFRINAPGLATIFFRVDRQWDEKAKEWGAPFVSSLGTSGQYSDDHRKWFLAIAEAARLHVEREKWNARQAERDRQEEERRAEPKPPTRASRLESLIREIARDEMPAEL